MVQMSSTISSRSNDSAATPTVSSFHVLAALLLFGFALLGLPRVSSFSLSSPIARPKESFEGRPSSSAPRSRSHSRSWWWLGASVSTDEDKTLEAAASTRTLMEAQAGGNSSNRRRRKERIQNFEASDPSTAPLEPFRSPQELPDPLVPFESVESVRLVDSSTKDGEKSVSLVELMLRSDEGDERCSKIINPLDLHQTSDFELWMALRKHVVDVSASQLSVVLGTNYFTSRDKLLQDKIRARESGSGSGSRSDDDDQENGAIWIVDESDEEKKQQSARSNSKACAWGIKMEPLAFAQYSDLVEATNNPDDDEGSPLNNVEETGMYLLRHVDPKTQKTYVFGASPDGLVTEHRPKDNSGDGDSTNLQPSVGLLEIKSLWGRRHKKSLPEFTNCPSRFYDQIQGQMAICDKQWCDLMVFIPPGDGKGSGGGGSKKRKGKSAKKRKKQAAAAAAALKSTRKSKGRNYSIVRVKRNEAYWTETVLPALIEFCDEVEAGKPEADAKETGSEDNTESSEA